METQVISPPSLPHCSILSLRSSMEAPGWLGGKGSRKPRPRSPRGADISSNLFSPRCPRAEHPPPAPRERGKFQPGEASCSLWPDPSRSSTAPARVLPTPIQGRKIPAGVPGIRPRDCLRSSSPGQHPLMNSHISDNPTETLK